MTGEGGRPAQSVSSLAEHRERLALVSRTLEREGHIVQREPEALPSHLHNMLLLDEGEEGPAGPLLARAREALAGRPWLRLTNRPSVGGSRSALLRVLDQEGVDCIAWAPDACTIAFPGGRPGRPAITLWDAVTGELRLSVSVEYRPVCMAWSPDGRLLALGSYAGTTYLWDADTGALAVALKGHTDDFDDCIEAILWSSDGGTVVSATRSGVVRFWDPVQGECRKTLEGHIDSISGLAWSGDGKELAVLGSDKVTFWDGSTRRVVRLRKPRDLRSAQAWAPNARTFAEAYWDGTIRLWDAATGRQRAILKGHRYRVNAVAWSPDGRSIASASDDLSVRLWDVIERRAVAVLRGHVADAEVVAWAPDGETLASTDGRRVYLWDVAAARAHLVPGKQQTELDEVNLLNWSPSGHVFCSVGHYASAIQVWDGVSGDLTATLEGHRRCVTTLAWSADGRVLASGGIDGALRLWGLTTDDYRAVLRGHKKEIRAIAWSPGGTRLASADGGNSILWDLATKKRLRVLKGDTGVLAWSPDSDLLASGGDDRTIRLWELDTGREGHRFECGDWVMRLAWSPDGRFLASAAYGERHLNIWDKRSRQLRVTETIPGKYGLWPCLAWSTDARTLAAGSGDFADVPGIYLWEGATGEGRGAVGGHRDHITALLWIDSQHLISASWDGTVRLWFRDAGRPLCVAHCLSPVLALQFSPDGGILRVADNGVATGNRPIPYLFELCNIEIGLPVATLAAPPTRPSQPERHGHRDGAFWRRRR